METSDASTESQTAGQTVQPEQEVTAENKASEGEAGNSSSEGVKLRYARCMCGQFQIELIG